MKPCGRKIRRSARKRWINLNRVVENQIEITRGTGIIVWYFRR